jgi:hypothetical protein
VRASVTALLLVVAACGGSGGAVEATDVDGIPVLEGHHRGPGTRIGDGFTVADGSVLVGDPLPPRAQYGPRRPEGWRALLLVTGGARDVLDAYARQAAAIGLPVAPQFTTGACRPDTELLACELWGEQRTSERTRRVELSLQRGRAEGDPGPVSHLVIRYETIGPPPYGEVVDNGCRCPPGDRDAPAPEDWPPLPGDGERLEAAVTRMQPGLAVEPGSQLVAHPTSLSEGYGASLALLVVTDDPEEVLAAYVDQLPDSYDHVEERSRFRGGTVLHRFWGQGGGTYQADLVLREGRPAYLAIEHSVTD